MSDQSGPSAEEVLAEARWQRRFGEVATPSKEMGEAFTKAASEDVAALRAACGDPSGWVVIGPDGTLYEVFDQDRTPLHAFDPDLPYSRDICDVCGYREAEGHHRPKPVSLSVRPVEPLR